ncbi:MAG TPA: AMP-binding protein [Polyangiaceae bacterium]|nr:AMP-binding protein [Polyangiaceae bacterium]
MAKLTEYTRYADAQTHADSKALWELFAGSREYLNIAHECMVRHADGSGRIAVRIAHSGGTNEALSFDDIAAGSARVAHWLEKNGIGPGDRIAFMLEPSLPFYVSLFGAMMIGAISVPLFTLFGLDGLRLRVDDCKPKLLITNSEKAEIARGVEGVRVVVADASLLDEMADFPSVYETATRADDLAVFQYTSGTTRELPAAVKHSHRALVTLMFAALYGTGIRPGDEFFCPSSPAWGHGLWHGTLAPLALGVTTGTFAGRFDAVRLMKALQDYEITNLSAAATHYRMMKNSEKAKDFAFSIKKLSYTGEPIDPATLEFIDRTFGVPACSMYGTTEIGVVLVNYPGANDYPVKPGSLGKPVPGQKLRVQRPDGTPAQPGVVGELMLWRRNAWETTKDLARIDGDGYFYHAGRADDVIISAGWTMSAVEIENTMLKHPAVKQAAVIAVPDVTRGQVAKAFVVTDRSPSADFATELQTFTRERLSQHEFPRHVAFVNDLPKTPAGKVNRKVLREREVAEASGNQRVPGRMHMADTSSADRFPKITEQGLDLLRKRIGVLITDTVEPWNHEATRDGIRHYAHGIGDDNPLWTDPIYAAATRFATIVALPSFLFSTSRIVSGYCGGLSGVHAMWAGADWTWHKHVLRGDVIGTQAYLKDLAEHQTRFAGRAFQQTYHTDFFNQHGDRVAECDSWVFRTDRDEARERGTKYTDVRGRVEPFGDEELAEFYKLYETEEIRGATSRHWEDVQEGDALPRMMKGPMTVTGFIGYAQGWGGLYIRANKLAWKLHSKHAGLGIKNRFNVPDCPERVHWDEAFALEVGAPGAYDYGPERCSWLTHHITNWMGDDGFLRNSKCQIRRHNPDGDVLFIEGIVSRKFIESGKHLVQIEQKAETHRGELSASGSAVVELPSRSSFR